MTCWVPGCTADALALTKGAQIVMSATDEATTPRHEFRPARRYGAPEVFAMLRNVSTSILGVARVIATGIEFCP
jgi:hypothetical protein